MVAGVVPYFITKNRLIGIFQKVFDFSQYTGIILIVMGLSIMLYCISQFAFDGQGTLSPADPTRQLVIKGLYRFSRNPMYIGVMLILMGESIFTNLIYLWIYTMIIFTAFHLFIVFWEEPRLKKDFGESYEKYTQTVRRWF
jgi:protein-S-isoprenylcysteine O-methyltransferase Ste14